MKKISLIAILLFLFGFAYAQASTLHYDSMLGTQLYYTANGSLHQMIDITYNQDTFKSPVGEFVMSSDSHTLKNLYCVEIDVMIYENTSYLYTLNSLDTITYGYEIAWLLNAYGNTVDTHEEGTAMNLAIWEILYGDYFSYDAGDTNDSLTTPEGKNIDALVQDYLGFYASMAVLTATEKTLLDSLGYRIADLKDTDYYDANPVWGEDIQDIIVQVSPVPEPGTFMLFSLGLLGLGAFGRRKP